MKKAVCLALICFVILSFISPKGSYAINIANPVDGISVWALLSCMMFGMVGSVATSNVGAGIGQRQQLEDGKIFGWVKADQTNQADANIGDKITINMKNVFLYQDETLTKTWLFLRQFSPYRVVDVSQTNGIKIYKVSASLK